MTHAHLHHAVVILYAENKIILDHVLVCKIILVILMRAVVQNVSSILTAPQILLVFETSARILAQELAD